jgi:hypothetical protein
MLYCLCFCPVAVAFLYEVHYISLTSALGAAPHKIRDNTGMLSAAGTDRKGRFVIRGFGSFQVFDESEFHFGTKHR